MLKYGKNKKNYGYITDSLWVYPSACRQSPPPRSILNCSLLLSARLGSILKLLGSPGRSKLLPGGLSDASWSLLGSHRPLGVLLEASWNALGGILGRSRRPPGLKTHALERLLAAPRRIPRPFSAILRAKRLPKRSPGGSQIGSCRRFELQTAKPQNFEDVLRNSLFF